MREKARQRLSQTDEDDHLVRLGKSHVDKRVADVEVAVDGDSAQRQQRLGRQHDRHHTERRAETRAEKPRAWLVPRDLPYAVRFFDAEQRPGAAAVDPRNTVAANAGKMKTPTRQSATAKLTIRALLTVDSSCRDRKTIASSSRFPVTVTTTSDKMAANWA